uniref:NNMT/PNMT/TEMT family protein n=2 Tax=Wuchereria bancrofti TaxID=6293 RepID=A0AAF5PVP9_WUCBA
MMTIENDTIVGPDGLESNFDSQAYLSDFYQRVDDPAMQMMIMLLPSIAERIDSYDNLLDFGAGPTIHVSVVFRNKVNNIYLADYLPQNRNELSRWADGKSTFNWTPALKMIASVEGSGWLQLEEMEQYTKSKIRSIFHCNCHNKPSINAPKILQNNFDIVATILCLEYCCSSEIEYKEAVQNVVDQVKPGGWFLMGGVLEETWCSFGGRKFTCLYLTENLLFEALREANLLVDDDQSCIYYCAQGIFLICCKKQI